VHTKLPEANEHSCTVAHLHFMQDVLHDDTIKEINPFWPIYRYEPYLLEADAMNRLLSNTFLLICLFLTFSLAVFGQSSANTEVIGGRGGTAFADSSDVKGIRILEIRVFSGDWVDAVQAVYLMPDGQIVEGSRHGGRGGRQSVFRLDSDEQVTGISGRHGDYIDSIRIHTSKRTSSLFGGRGGNRDFRIEVPSGNQAIGFTGRSGDYVDAIGLAYAPIWIRPSGETESAGRRGGKPFSDIGIPQGAKVSAVYIWSGDLIDRIQFVYSLPNGSIFEGEGHGGRGGRRVVFKLNDDEYITGISGRHGDYIDSIRIHTNRRTSSLFGGRGGNREFKVDVPSGNQAVGLTGRSGKYLDAVGLVYISVRGSGAVYPKVRSNRNRGWR